MKNLFGVTTLLAVAATACFGGGEMTNAQKLPEGVFNSSAIQGRTLVEDTTIELTLDGETVGVYAGCNTMSGEYVFADGTLRVQTPMASTQIGCLEDLDEQDRWVARWLGGGVKLVDVNETSFTLDGGGVTVTFVLPQDAPLVGTTWTLSSIIYGGSPDGAVASVPLGVPPTGITFSEENVVKVSGECVNGTAKTSAAGGLVETITLEDIELAVDNDFGCGGETKEITQGVVGVLTSRELSIVVARNSLTLTIVGFTGGFNEISGLGFSSESTPGKGTGGGANKAPGITTRVPDIAGIEENRAAAILEDAGFTMRVVERDGETFVVTDDYQLERVNVVITGGVVTESSVG